MTEEEKNKKRRKHGSGFWILLIVYVFLAMAFIGSAVIIYRQYANFRQSIDEYNMAREIAGIPDMSDLPDMFMPEIKTDDTLHVSDEDNADSSTTECKTQEVNEYEWDKYIVECLRLTDIKALQAINPDVIGWIYITATDISYPIMHADSNDRYIRSSWMDSSVYLTAGAIFMESMNSPDFSDFNTVLYGHRMRNETMFGKIKYYNSESYLKSHPSIYIVTENSISRYDIYAAYEVSTSGKTFQLGFGDDESKRSYINYTLKSSVYNTGIVPAADDHILTLSTCSGVKDYSTRWIVQAVKRGEEIKNNTIGGEKQHGNEQVCDTNT